MATVMNMRRNIFLAAIALLVVAIVAISGMTLAQGPRTSSVRLISRDGSTAQVDDLYEGNMSIPFYDIAQNRYKPDDFAEEKGVVEYIGEGSSTVGISVNEKKGDIDWQQVKENGVDFVMIRVGLREKIKGRIRVDANFEKNIQGAADAGLAIGVYFYSKAVTDAEAEAEATFVLEQIRDYDVSISYPIAIYWEYDLKDDGTQDESSRTVRRNGEQVTGFIDTFCNKIKVAGFHPCYFAEKSMAYNRLNLGRLGNYDLWYGEYRAAPSFFYDFAIWQYTENGRVPGISEPVPINIAMKSY